LVIQMLIWILFFARWFAMEKGEKKEGTF